MKRANVSSIAVVLFIASCGGRTNLVDLAESATTPGGTGTECEEVVISPDGQSYAYTYSSHASDLYLVLGLK